MRRTDVYLDERQTALLDAIEASYGVAVDDPAGEPLPARGPDGRARNLDRMWWS